MPLGLVPHRNELFHPNDMEKRMDGTKLAQFAAASGKGVLIAGSIRGDFILPMSKRLLKLSVPSAILLGGLILSSPFTSFGKTEYTKKESKGCTYCHTAAGKKDLNDIGKCYAEHNHSLADCASK